MTSVSVVSFGTSKTSLPFTRLPGLMVSRTVTLPSLAYSSATPSFEYSAPWASNAFCDEPSKVCGASPMFLTVTSTRQYWPCAFWPSRSEPTHVAPH